MARLVAAFGSSHSIMLTAEREDWLSAFRDSDRRMELYDRSGARRSYDEMLAVAPPDAETMVTRDRLVAAHEKTFAAIAELKRHIDATALDALVIVGDGPERERLENQVQAAGLKSVYFEGAVDYDYMASYYAAADAFVIPTLEDNWSLVVPEAMACGLPILCSKYNGCWPELVQERNGWVFDPLDPQDTLRGMKACIERGPELPGMGNSSTSGRRRRAISSPARSLKKISLWCRRKPKSGNWPMQALSALAAAFVIQPVMSSRGMMTISAPPRSTAPGLWSTTCATAGRWNVSTRSRARGAAKPATRI